MRRMMEVKSRRWRDGGGLCERLTGLLGVIRNRGLPPIVPIVKPVPMLARIGFVFSHLLLAGSGICSDDALDRQTVEARAMCQIEEPAQTIDAGKYPWELLKEPRFRSAYLSVLGYEPPKKHWLSLSGPAPRSKTVMVNGREFTYIWSCKQHECNTHAIHLLFDAREAVMFGLLAEDSSTSLLGNPSKCIQETIEERLPRK